jgi:hypothetical protein
MFAEFVPGDLVGGVLADQGLSFIRLHGNGSGAQYSSHAVPVPLAACQAFSCGEACQYQIRSPVRQPSAA